MAASKRTLTAAKLTLPTLFCVLGLTYGCNLLLDVSGYTTKDAGPLADAQVDGSTDAGPTDGGREAEPPPPGAVAVKWARWPMPNVFDGGSYTITGNDIYDKTTKLTWLSTLDTAKTYDEAFDYCNKAGGGLKAYRLPTRIELVSLLDLSIVNGQPKVSPATGLSLLSTSYWTQSYIVPRDPAGYRFWMVNFGSGLTEQKDPVNAGVVCVADVQ